MGRQPSPCTLKKSVCFRSELHCVLGRVSVAVKTPGLVHCHYGGKHGSMLQADVVLEKELRVLHPDPQSREVNAILGLA